MSRTLVGLVLLAFPTFACGGGNEAAETGAEEVAPAEAPAPDVPEGTQIVQVRVEGDAYLFTPSSVQAGLPVRLVFDPNGLPGCSRDVAIADFDITKTIVAGDATIDFTPTVPGPIAVACTMNMYRGSLVAE